MERFTTFSHRDCRINNKVNDYLKENHIILKILVCNIIAIFPNFLIFLISKQQTKNNEKKIRNQLFSIIFKN